MTINEQKAAARTFAEQWAGRGFALETLVEQAKLSLGLCGFRFSPYSSTMKKPSLRSQEYH